MAELNEWFYKKVVRDLDNLNLVKLRCGGLVLGSNQFLILPQVPQKRSLALKVVESDSKILLSSRFESLNL